MAVSPLTAALRTLGRKGAEVKTVRYSPDGRLAEIEFFPPAPVYERPRPERLGGRRPTGEDDPIEASDLMGQEHVS